MRRLWKLIHRLRHEISELEICLESPPNLEFAYDRLVLINEALEQFLGAA
jgi:hypothetical protein